MIVLRMKKPLLFAFMLIVSIISIQARPIDRSLAFIAAQQFSSTQFAVERDVPELVFTGAGEAFFVFNIGEHGFVIIAGDDAHRPIIGYSDESAFDATNIPPALTYYLDGVAECVHQLRHAIATPDVAAEWNSVLQHGRLIPRHSRGTGYFCQTKWDQSYPYNYCCPDDPEGSGGHAIVGCLATAMSQLMRFWAYPAQGIGSHCYTHETYGQICADFGNTLYDWEKMPNELKNNSSEAEKLATGTLCFHCGVTIDMGYGPDGSGGGSGPIPDAMHSYFNYSDAIVQLRRDDYDTETWKAMVREQFDMGWPMYYGGCQDGGCHAFVCDGYDDFDMFHFNLGWGGGSNGWYLIDDAPYTHPADAMFNFVPAEIYNHTPSLPTDFTAVPVSDNEPKVHLSWTNPTTTLDGTALELIEQVVVLRDNEVIATLTDVAPGAALEFEDTSVPRYDMFHYAVYVIADGRVGKHANNMKVMVGPSCNWRVIMTSNDDQGWKGGSLMVISPTGREITSMTTTSATAVQVEPELPLGRLCFVWSAPEELVNQMSFVIKNADGQTVYSYSGSSNDLSEGIIFETNNNCGNDVICDTPQNLVATPQGDAILLTWDAVENNPSYGYNIYRDGLLYRLIQGNSYLDEPEALGGHCYRVGMFCEGGDSGEHSNESCTTVGPCYPPRNLDFEYTNTYKVKLKWEKPLPYEGLAGYYLYRKDGDGEYRCIKVIGASSVNCTDNTLQEEGDYYYRLYAYYRDLDCTSSPANRHYYDNVFELHVYYSPTGVDENEAQVKVYPNPAKGFVMIEAEGMTSVSIYNALGQCMLEREVAENQTTLNLQKLSEGLYLLRVKTESGIISKRITIEH